ncbi:MAG: LacI family DNA-binding transcriptional regulator [Leuconostoc sp.]|uniref:LacI family DNA-binding transcriptional regulator n=1 Tax=Leuconostoc sp. TaxID=1930076 RepID=UPI0039E743F6
MVAKLSDVAELAGVSITTVSRVINSYGSLSQKTIDKVHAAMRELHYQPNAMARSLQGKSSQFIGLIFPNIQNPFFTALASEIEQLLFEKGYKVIIATSANNVEKEQQYLQMLVANQVEGIITSSHNLGIASYQDNFLPIVSYDRHLADNIPIVHEDNYRGGQLIGEYFVSQNAKNLLVLCDNDASTSPTSKRYVGFADAVAGKSHLLVKNFDSNTFVAPADIAAIVEIVRTHKIDGVFAYNDMMAIQLQNALRKANLRVPEDVIVAGYDGSPIVQQLHPDLPTIVQPIHEAAQRLIDVLFAEINHAALPELDVLPVTLHRPE